MSTAPHDNTWDITPGLGVGPLLFGMRRHEVEAVLGPPDHVADPDEDGDVHLKYEQRGVDLYFDAEEDWRLSILEVSARPGLTIAGVEVSHATNEEVVRVLSASGISFCAPTEVEDETQHASTDGNLTLYSEDGVVTSISLSVRHDQADTPMWAAGT